MAEECKNDNTKRVLFASLQDDQLTLQNAEWKGESGPPSDRLPTACTTYNPLKPSASLKPVLSRQDMIGKAVVRAERMRFTAREGTVDAMIDEIAFMRGPFKYCACPTGNKRWNPFSPSHIDTLQRKWKKHTSRVTRDATQEQGWQTGPAFAGYNTRAWVRAILPSGSLCTLSFVFQPILKLEVPEKAFKNVLLCKRIVAEVAKLGKCHVDSSPLHFQRQRMRPAQKWHMNRGDVLQPGTLPILLISMPNNEAHRAAGRALHKKRKGPHDIYEYVMRIHVRNDLAAKRGKEKDKGPPPQTFVVKQHEHYLSLEHQVYELLQSRPRGWVTLHLEHWEPVPFVERVCWGAQHELRVRGKSCVTRTHPAFSSCSSEEEAPTLIVSFDGEMCSFEGNRFFCHPARPNDVISVLGMSVAWSGKVPPRMAELGFQPMDVCHRVALVLAPTAPVDSTVVVHCNTEAQLLDNVRNMMCLRWDADVVTGWNIYNFDNPYLVVRARMLEDTEHKPVLFQYRHWILAMDEALSHQENKNMDEFMKQCTTLLQANQSSGYRQTFPRLPPCQLFPKRGMLDGCKWDEGVAQRAEGASLNSVCMDTFGPNRQKHDVKHTHINLAYAMRTEVKPTTITAPPTQNGSPSPSPAPNAQTRKQRNWERMYAQLGDVRSPNKDGKTGWNYLPTDHPCADLSRNETTLHATQEMLTNRVLLYEQKIQAEAAGLFSSSRAHVVDTLARNPLADVSKDIAACTSATQSTGKGRKGGFLRRTCRAPGRSIRRKNNNKNSNSNNKNNERGQRTKEEPSLSFLQSRLRDTRQALQSVQRDLKQWEHIWEKRMQLRASPHDQAAIAAYCMQDCDLVVNLLHVLGYIGQVAQQCNLSLSPFSMLPIRKQQYKLVNIVASEAHRRGMVMNGMCEDTFASKFKYKGGRVLMPQKGLHAGPTPEQDLISTQDFASLYPSIMRTHNLCPSVWVSPLEVEELRDNGMPVFGEVSEATKDGEPDYDLRYRQYFVQNIPETVELDDTTACLIASLPEMTDSEDGESRAYINERKQVLYTRVPLCIVDGEEHPVPPAREQQQELRNMAKTASTRGKEVQWLQRNVLGPTIRCRGSPALLPDLLKGLFYKRKYAKKMMKQCKARGDTNGYNMWNCRQLALKVFMNACYGFLGNGYDKETLACMCKWGFAHVPKVVCLRGERYLRRSIAIIESKEIKGMWSGRPVAFGDVCEVIYGDTDSVMVHFYGPMLEGIACMYELEKVLTAFFGGAMAMEFEDMYDTFLTFMSKIYMGMKFAEPTLEVAKAFFAGAKTIQLGSKQVPILKAKYKGMKIVRRDAPNAGKRILKEVGDCVIRRGAGGVMAALGRVARCLVDIVYDRVPMEDYSTTCRVKHEDGFKANKTLPPSVGLTTFVWAREKQSPGSGLLPEERGRFVRVQPRFKDATRMVPPKERVQMLGEDKVDCWSHVCKETTDKKYAGRTSVSAPAVTRELDDVIRRQEALDRALIIIVAIRSTLLKFFPAHTKAIQQLLVAFSRDCDRFDQLRRTGFEYDRRTRVLRMMQAVPRAPRATASTVHTDFSVTDAYDTSQFRVSSVLQRYINQNQNQIQEAVEDEAKEKDVTSLEGLVPRAAHIEKRRIKNLVSDTTTVIDHRFDKPNGGKSAKDIYAIRAASTFDPRTGLFVPTDFYERRARMFQQKKRQRQAASSSAPNRFKSKRFRR